MFRLFALILPVCIVMVILASTAMADGAPSPDEIPKLVAKLRKEMREAAGDLDFERAAELRDQIRDLETGALMKGFEAAPKTGRGRGRRRR